MATDDGTKNLVEGVAVLEILIGHGKASDHARDLSAQKIRQSLKQQKLWRTEDEATLAAWAAGEIEYEALGDRLMRRG